MKHTYVKETLIAIALIVLLVCLANPFDTYMLSMLESFILGGVFIVFSFFASFFWRENAQDEREEIHRSLAGRVAFLVGSIVLLIGIAFEIRSGTLDVWLIAALVSMIVAKIAARMYSERRF
ncbi:MAG: hypothetical protein K9M11_02090 [Candidatus Pacebacteria bacterium]|nr:hypothetical protein [Candidatus Paceibacterota bacterium]